MISKERGYGAITGANCQLQAASRAGINKYILKLGVLAAGILVCAAVSFAQGKSDALSDSMDKEYARHFRAEVERKMRSGRYGPDQKPDTVDYRNITDFSGFRAIQLYKYLSEENNKRFEGMSREQQIGFWDCLMERAQEHAKKSVPNASGEMHKVTYFFGFAGSWRWNPYDTYSAGITIEGTNQRLAAINRFLFDNSNAVFRAYVKEQCR